MRNRLLPQIALYLGLFAAAVLNSACTTVGEMRSAKAAPNAAKTHALDYMQKTPDEERYRLVISIPDQRMALLDGDKVVQEYAISTALKGVSEALNSDGTPRGLHVIAEKIGDGQPVGMVFKGREPTGVISELNPTEGIPPVVTRLFRLRGLEASNQTTYDRLIYLHGSPHEALLGQPASGGCIRMSSPDVVELFKTIEVGTPITILERALPDAVASTLETQRRFRQTRQLAYRALSKGSNESLVHRMCYGHSYGEHGVPQNYPAAKMWCQYGVDLRVASSMTLLAEHYELGRTEPIDLGAARALYEKAAALDHPFALSKVALMQQHGIGGPKDSSAAKKNGDRGRFLQATKGRASASDSDVGGGARAQ